jgi:hypothetical protein
MHLTHRKTCRVCGSTNLKPVISLGDQHLQGSFAKENITPPFRKIPCELVRCDPTQNERGCGLLQMAHSVPPELLYSSYWYMSGTNRTMQEHLKGLVNAVTEMGFAKDDLAALDIGCNDGTLLDAYTDSWTTVGIDPSDISQKIDSGRHIIVQGLFPGGTVDAHFPNRLYDVITSIAMFYDLEDPVGFSHHIKQLLAPNGIWVVEMSYMPMMLTNTSYDTICHEHLEYYSFSVLETIFKRCHLKVIRAEINDINGGSIRCYVTHSNSPRQGNKVWRHVLEELRQSEFDLELDTDKPYRSFQDRINLHRDELIALVKKIKRDGETIHLYGASTKGNTILQWCGLDSRIIVCAADRNPAKWGAWTLGTDIPIVSEEVSRAMKPDYYLVLPWHFKKEFLEREAETIHAGTRFIFPLPKVEVVPEEPQ